MHSYPGFDDILTRMFIHFHIFHSYLEVILKMRQKVEHLWLEKILELEAIGELDENSSIEFNRE